MELLKKAFGICVTNCYILKTAYGEFIIDAGQNSASWVIENVCHPLAILNTHGHFDHIWCNAELRETFEIPILCPKEDAFMLKSDCFNTSLTPFAADIEVENNEIFYFDKSGLIGSNLRPNLRESTKGKIPTSQDSKDSPINVEFMFFPGHTPGCSIIKIGDYIFSGDFVFLNSIGRTDFPYSNPKDMRDSLLRFKKLPFDCTLYPGHGTSTTIRKEQNRVDFWLSHL